MRRRLLRVAGLAGCGVLVVALGVIGPGPVDASEQQRLDQAREKLEAVRAEIDQLDDQREERRDRLQAAEARVAEVVEAVHTAEMAVQRQEEAVRNARDRYEVLQSQANARRQAMANRAAELYQQGTGVSMTAMLASDSVDEAVTRSTYLELVQRSDQAGFEQIAADQVALDAQKEVLAEEEEALRERLVEQEAILAEARELREERALQLAGTEDQLDDLQDQERHLESESRELAAMARRADQQPAARQAEQVGGSAGAAPASDSTSSGWQWPFGGPVTSEYGMRWGRMHEGIDIGGSTGAPVVAARSGTVSHAGRMGGYGNLVLVNHGGGISTAYAHLSSFSVSPGQAVGAGQQVGGMGCTGSCRGTHVHFEVRVNGAARNPRNYLP